MSSPAPTVPYSLVVPSKPIDWANVNFSDAECLGWDSYCVQKHAPYCPPLQTWSTPEAKFNFRRVLMTRIKNEFASWLDYYTTTRVNLMQQTVASDSIDTKTILQCVSYAMCETYVNNYRSKINPQAPDFDMAQVPWLTLPNVSTVLQWYYDYLDIFYGRQIMDTAATQVDSSAYPATLYTYGYFKPPSGGNVGLRDAMWKVIGFANCHTSYAHLFSSERLLLGRTHILAAYTSLRRCTDLIMPDTAVQSLMSQYSNAVVGSVLCATFLLQSEKLLTARGVAIPAMTGAPDWTQGRWTTDEAVSYAENLCLLLSGRMMQEGMWTEVSGSYVYYLMGNMCTGMLHACSAKAFFMLEQVWCRQWRGLTACYQPEAGCLSGPVTRSYNLFENRHQRFDNLDTPLYINSLLRPDRQTLTGVAVTDTDIPLVKYISTDTPYVDFVRHDFGMRQLAGFAFLPETLVHDTIIARPSRTFTERMGQGKQQYRHNYVTSEFALGHCGPVTPTTGLTIHVLGRFSPMSRDPQTDQNNSVFRFMLNSNDNPFAGSGVPGDGVQLEPRLIAVQDQNVLLFTTMAYTIPSQSASCLNSDVFVPLNMDSISWIQGETATPLPGTIPTGTPLASAVTLAAAPLIQLSLGSGVDNLLVATRGSTTFVGKLLLYESDIEASVATKNDSFAVNSGLEPTALMWQVGLDERKSAVGRLIIHHRHKSSQAPATSRAYRVAWLWAMYSAQPLSVQQAKVDRSAAITLIRSARINMDAVVSSAWDYITPKSTLQWGMKVVVPGTQLGVSRTDTFQPNPNDRSVYLDTEGTAAVAPIVTTASQQVVNGLDHQTQLSMQTALFVNACVEN